MKEQKFLEISEEQIKILKKLAKNKIGILCEKLIKTANEPCLICHKTAKDCDCFVYYDAQIDMLCEFVGLDKNKVMTDFYDLFIEDGDE